MLEVRSISAGYGRVSVLHDVSLSVRDGEFVALVGVNGAGKSTLMRCISGLIAPSGGEVAFAGEALRPGSTEASVEAGIVLVPEGRLVFPQMTVMENLLLGGTGRRARPHRSATLERVFETFPRLRERREQLASTMSGGEQQMLAIGRALMAMPKILILDEPSLGLSPIAARDTFLALRQLHRSGLSLLLVEQNVRASLALASRAYVIENGRIEMAGDAKALADDPRVRKAYLGL